MSYDKLLQKEHFIFLNDPNHVLTFTELVDNEGCFVLHFTKQSISVRFDNFLNSSNVLVRMFNLVLLHHICGYIKECSNDTLKDPGILETLLLSIFDRINLSNLNHEVVSVIKSHRFKCCFVTMAHHFVQAYGILKSVTSGYRRYPPLYESLYIPPLPLSKYKTENKPILFHNEMHVVPLEFKSYDFHEHVTVLNSKPVFDPSCNFLIRDYLTGTFRIQSMFQYQKAEHAKLARTSENNVNRYMFLLQIVDKYFEVKAIYPVGRVHTVQM